MTKTDIVRAAFKGRRLTVRDIAAELGWKTDVAHGIVSHLMKSGQVTIVGKKKLIGDRTMHVFELSEVAEKIMNPPKINYMPLWEAFGLPQVQPVNRDTARRFDVDDFPHWDEKLKPLVVHIGTSHKMLEGAVWI